MWRSQRTACAHCHVSSLPELPVAVAAVGCQLTSTRPDPSKHRGSDECGGDQRIQEATKDIPDGGGGLCHYTGGHPEIGRNLAGGGVADGSRRRRSASER